MIHDIIDFLKTCPLLSDYLLTAEFLGEKGSSIGVFVQPAAPVVERYADGGVLKQFVFRLSCRYTNHEINPGAISALFDSVAVWLESTEALPVLRQGRMAQRLEVLKNGAMAERSYGTNRYDMDCRLIYYLEKGSET